MRSAVSTNASACRPQQTITVLLVFLAPCVTVLAFFAFSRDPMALLIAVIVLAFSALSLTGVGAPFSMKMVMPVADNGNPWVAARATAAPT